MDPVIIAAIITAASKAAPTIFERVVRGAPSGEAKIQKLVATKYSDLKNVVDPPCVKLLKYAEDGTYHDVRQFRTHLYPNLTFRDHMEEDKFNHEFEYRLRYLVATGFFTFTEALVRMTWSRSVAVMVRLSPSASIRKLERMGMVVLRSTTD